MFVATIVTLQDLGQSCFQATCIGDHVELRREAARGTGCHTPPDKEMSGRRRRGNVKGCGVTADDALRSYPPPSLFYCSPVPVIQSLPGARSGASLPAVVSLRLPAPS